MPKQESAGALGAIGDALPGKAGALGAVSGVLLTLSNYQPAPTRLVGLTGRLPSGLASANFSSSLSPGIGVDTLLPDQIRNKTVTVIVFL